MRSTRFVLVALLTFIIGRYLATHQGPTLLYWAITLPGTFFHEAAHWLAALALQGNPQTFSIIPTFDLAGNMTSMGHITSYPNWYNAATVGLAPMLLVPFMVFCLVKASNASPLWIAIWSYFAACSWASAIPSSQDISVAMVPTSWPLALVIFGFTGYWTIVLARRAMR